MDTGAGDEGVEAPSAGERARRSRGDRADRRYLTFVYSDRILARALGFRDALISEFALRRVWTTVRSAGSFERGG